MWIGVVLAVIGMYFLCMTSGFSIEKGDFYVLLGSIAFSFHILVIDHFSSKVDGVKMSSIQFFVCGILCSVPRITQPASTENTDSRLNSRDATVGSVFFCATICKV